MLLEGGIGSLDLAAHVGVHVGHHLVRTLVRIGERVLDLPQTRRWVNLPCDRLELDLELWAFVGKEVSAT